MTRAERRREAREQKKAAAFVAPLMQMDTVTPKQLEEMAHRIKAKSTEDALVLAFAVPVMVLHKQWGWGSKTRLPKFADQLTDEYQRIFDAGLPLVKYAADVEKLTGISFRAVDGDLRGPKGT